MNYVKLKNRILAFIMDIVIVGFPMVLLLVLILFLAQPSQSVTGTLITVIPLLTFFIYFSLSCLKGQSIGKKYIGAKVVKENGEKCSLLNAALRSVLKIFLFWINWTSIPGSKEKAAFHDLLSGTRVVHLEGETDVENNEQNRIGFIKKTAIILPSLTVLLFLFLFISKSFFKSALVTKSSFVIYIVYLAYPLILLTSVFGLTISVQAIKQKVLKINIGRLLAVVNGLFLALYLYFTLHTFLKM